MNLRTMRFLDVSVYNITYDVESLGGWGVVIIWWGDIPYSYPYQYLSHNQCVGELFIPIILLIQQLLFITIIPQHSMQSLQPRTKAIYSIRMPHTYLLHRSLRKLARTYEIKNTQHVVCYQFIIYVDASIFIIILFYSSPAYHSFEGITTNQHDASTPI